MSLDVSPALRRRLPIWLAVPWRDRGHDLSGWDCWGLVAWVSAEAFGRRLPAFAGAVETACDSAAVEAAVRARMAGFRCCAPAPGAIALFLALGAPLHVGLFLSQRHVLHALQGVGTTLVDLNHDSRWRARLMGTYEPSPEAVSHG